VILVYRANCSLFYRVRSYLPHRTVGELNEIIAEKKNLEELALRRMLDNYHNHPDIPGMVINPLHILLTHCNPVGKNYYYTYFIKVN
jgi:hypothetical protein